MAATIRWTSSPNAENGILPAYFVSFVVTENDETIDYGEFTVTATSSEPGATAQETTVAAPYRPGIGARYNIKDIVLSAVGELAYTVETGYPGIKAWRAVDVAVSVSAKAYFNDGTTPPIASTTPRTSREHLSVHPVPTRDPSPRYFDMVGGMWFPDVNFGAEDNNTRLYAIDADGTEYESYSPSWNLFIECPADIVEVGRKSGASDYLVRCFPRYRNNGMVIRYWDSRKGGFSSIVAECGETVDAAIRELGLFECLPASLDEPESAGRTCEMERGVMVRGKRDSFDDLREMLASVRTEYYDNGTWRRCIVEGDAHLQKNGFYQCAATVRSGFKTQLSWL